MYNDYVELKTRRGTYVTVCMDAICSVVQIDDGYFTITLLNNRMYDIIGDYHEFVKYLLEDD